MFGKKANATATDTTIVMVKQYKVKSFIKSSGDIMGTYPIVDDRPDRPDQPGNCKSNMSHKVKLANAKWNSFGIQKRPWWSPRKHKVVRFVCE